MTSHDDSNSPAGPAAVPAWADWRGRRVAFLGDSMTDAAHIGCSVNYWGVLERDAGVVPLVFGVNGAQWSGIPEQAGRLAAAHGGAVDDIFVLAGTNDFNSNVPLGVWFDVRDSVADRGHGPVPVRSRRFSRDGATLRGRINNAMSVLRENWPEAGIFLMTPIHRGYAKFGPGNVQPDESNSNELGLFIDDYVRVVKEAGNVWAAVAIDTNAESGLFPLFPRHDRFFHDGKTDMLHPGDLGHERIALAVERRLGMAAVSRR